MSSETGSPLPSRRARRDAERAAQRAAERATAPSASRGLPAVLRSLPATVRGATRPRSAASTTTAPRAVLLATLGGLTVGLPLAGMSGIGLPSASAAPAPVVAQANLVDVLDTASATAALEGGQATSLTMDQAGQARVELVAASREIGTTPTCAPAAGANGVAAAMTTEVAAAPAVVQPMTAGSYEITSGYGGRIHPIFGVARMHEGVDYAAPAGTPIHAVAAGTVIHSGPNIGAAGTLVVIEHELDGQVWTSWYLHMYSQDIAVTEGQQVRSGDLVGLVGSAGNSTGPHLHLEIHQGPGTGGATVEPTSWLAQHGAVEVGTACA